MPTTHTLSTAATTMPGPGPMAYQGSKRKLVPAILRSIPADLAVLHEPFAGSAAVSLAVATARPDVEIRLNDDNPAVAALWSAIIERPDELADRYEVHWTQQLPDPRSYYDEVRDRFNATGDPDLFLYLLARCVKAAVRYNRCGEFNQSADHRRLGTRPSTMLRSIKMASARLSGRTQVTSLDFRAALAGAGPADVAYLDPPYQGVSAGRDRRYAGGVGYDELVVALHDLNRRHLPYVLSYDGRTGERVYGKALPGFLRLRHQEIDSGRSTQATLGGGDARTVESLHLSAALVERLEKAPGALLEEPGPASEAAFRGHQND